jgi:hypothetical protein
MKTEIAFSTTFSSPTLLEQQQQQEQQEKNYNYNKINIFSLCCVL